MHAMKNYRKDKSKSTRQVATKYLLGVAFVVGMGIIAIEMAASRLLTPYFGSSLYIWTNIIGIIMIALTIGYYVGGRVADQYASERLLYCLILAAGVYISLVPFLARPIISAILPLITEHPLSVFYTSFLATLLLFVVPFIFLSMVTPCIIKLRLQRVALIGYTAGTVAAYATLGSILGTFLPTFLVLPFLGTSKTMLLFAGLLIATAMIGLIKGALKR